MVGAVAAPVPGPVPVAGGVVVAGLVRPEAGRRVTPHFWA